MTEASNERALAPGMAGEASLTVTEAHTAQRLGSGRAPVLGTPAMVALMEAAAVACVEDRLGCGEQTLGVHLDVEHIAPTRVGADVAATAVLIAVDNRRLAFTVEAHEGEKVIGRGTHKRVIVDSARFHARLAE